VAVASEVVLAFVAEREPCCFRGEIAGALRELVGGGRKGP
jgi:hypothetical protein